MEIYWNLNHFMEQSTSCVMFLTFDVDKFIQNEEKIQS